MAPSHRQIFRLAALAGLAVLLFLTGRSSAAEPLDYLIDLWSADNGLPDSSVTAITQTPDGYLWVGTHNGLARFDGVSFQIFDPLNTPALKHARVLGLFTDAQGTLWINTYDGSLTSLRRGVFTSEVQRCGPVFSVYSYSNRVAIATFSSGVLLHPEPGKGSNAWQRINLALRNDGGIFCQDADGVIWYLLRDGRLGRIKDDKAVGFPTNNALTGERINCLTTDPDGRVWVGTAAKILRWSGSQFVDETPTNGEAAINTTFLFFTALDDFWAFANGTVRHAVNRQWTTNLESWRALAQSSPLDMGAYADRSKNVWFRQLGHGLFYAGRNGRIERMTSANGLPGDRVNCWFQDREGNIWVGMDRGGLVRLRKKQFQVIGPEEGLKNFDAGTVCEDLHSNIWIGTIGSGLYRWSGGELKRFELPQGGNRDSFFSAFPDAQGRLWLSADREDLYLLETNQIVRGADAVHGIKAILADREGRIWFGLQTQLACLADGRVTNYGPWNGFTRTDVRTLAEDRTGNIWIGAGNGILYKFADGRFTAFKPEDGPEAEAIWALLPEDDGSLWVGTFRGGLLRFQDGKFTRYTTKDGLPSNIICQILDDGLGKLWFGSHNGIFNVPKAAFMALGRGKISSLPCIAYGLYDGLPTLECSGNYQPSAWRAHDGRLWFTTVKGAVAVNPERVQLNHLPPPVAIEQFLVDGKNFAPDGAVKIPPGRHQFDFRFTALSFAAPDKVLFRYKLAGFDNAWVEGDNRRAAHYGPLPPGQYQFQVTACNNDGVWNDEGAVLAFNQLPFLWQTWWFKALAAIVLIAAISGMARYAATRSLRRKLERLKQQHAIERERERIAKDIHDDLGAGLTQIMLQSSLARREPPDRMQTDLTQISETARDLVRAMDEIVWAINPENDTLEGLVTYLGKFVQEFSAAAKLRCRLDLPPEPPAIAVSAETRHNLFLAIKETLNNIAKHARATEVFFQLKLQPGSFALIIKDNGVGFTPGAPDGTAPGQERLSSGHGLSNLVQRLEGIGGRCAIHSQPGQGAEVELQVPAAVTARNDHVSTAYERN